MAASACCSSCGEMWTGLDRCHCTDCHETFNSTSAFDRHRRGGTCLSPREAGLSRTQRGYWARPATPERTQQLETWASS